MESFTSTRIASVYLERVVLQQSPPYWILLRRSTTRPELKPPFGNTPSASAPAEKSV